MSMNSVYLKIAAPEMYEHCETIAEMCRRIAYVYNVPCNVTADQIYSLFQRHDWQANGTPHTAKTPLTVELVTAPRRLSSLSIRDIQPRFLADQRIGEYNLISKRQAYGTFAA